MSYLVWEKETAPTTGTIHIQGYLRLQTRLRLNQVKALLKQDAHLELARGSEEQNRTYCSKERDGIDWGETGDYEPDLRQGKRSDLEEIAQEVIAGTGMEEIALKYPTQWIRYHQGLQNLHQITMSKAPTSRTVTTTILWGASGVGKTHRVRTAYPECYVVIPGRDPWANYTGQETILFDEFNPEEWKIQMMNHYLDKWKLQLDSRYFNKQAAWNKVFICSNLNPSNWYNMYQEELRSAFYRRITYTIEIKDRNQELLLI